MINNNYQDSGSFSTAWMICNMMATGSSDSAADGAPSGNVEPELEEVARKEQEYVRGRLREELQREPTEEEMDEWLRQHTEGY